MAHLVDSLKNESIAATRAKLAAAHEFIVSRAQTFLRQSPMAVPGWGSATKRLSVDLSGSERPELIKKPSERFAEILNMAATVERLLAALQWFAEEPRFRDLEVLICHPSTSSSTNTNDLVLAEKHGLVCVRCEVSDVAARSAGQNAKEKKDLKALRCDAGVPDDGVYRFLCTSNEFAEALISKKRDWTALPYRYIVHRALDDSRTVILEIVPPSSPRLLPGAGADAAHHASSSTEAPE
ncbi:MAG: hypothetical protein HUU21_09575 [Polyangiaceae bacterium]|nr:hypothetical protein [Polyangiaceae bacterium]NUQ73793.1 hypothetical protein [Polyangiaceae bacterium]